METSESAAQPETNAESAAELGARLRHAREKQGIGLEEVSAELRIGPHFLGAIEDGRFEALGPAVFAKGYLKQYGAKLGLDVAELAASYDRAVGQPSVDLAPSRSIKLRDDRQIAIWVVAALALAAVAFVLWFWWTRFASESAAPASAAATAAVTTIDAGRVDAGRVGAADEPPGEPARSTSFGTVDAAAVVTAASVQAPTTSAPSADAVAASAVAAPANDTAARDLSEQRRAGAPGTAEPLALETSAAAASPAPPETPPAPLAEAPPRPSATAGPALELHFVEDSWAEITDDSGQRLYYALGRAGTSERIPADRTLHILLGNAHGVELEFAGRSIPIPGSHERGDVAQFDLDALTE